MKPVPLQSIAEITMGTAPPGETYNGSGDGMPMIAGAGDYGDIHPEPKKWTTHPIAVARKGDLIICVRATIGDLNWADREYCLGRGVAGIRTLNGHTDIRYIAHFLDSAKARLSEKGSGSTFPAIRRADLADFPIPIPFHDDPYRSLAEQKRIAAILDKADTIRRRRQEAARLADTLISSVFYEMFGDPVTNPKGWFVERLDRVAQLDRGRSRHRPRDWPPLYGGPYPLIQTGDIANCKGVIRKYTQTYSEEGLAQSKLWPKGTLCITIAANIGKTGVLAFDACFPDSVVGLVAGPRLTIEYVREWFVAIQKNLDESAPQVAQKNINLAILNGLEIPVPPKPLQQRFSQIVESVRAAQEGAAVVEAQVDTLVQSLVQRAFRGEL